MAGLKKIEDKNGYVEADFISAIIIIIMFLIMIIGLSLMQKSEIEITSLKERVNDDIFLMNILRSDQGTGKVYNIINEDYSRGEGFEDTKAAVDSAMQSAFGKKICWSMVIQGKTIKSDGDCIESYDAGIGKIDAKAYIPYEVVIPKQEPNLIQKIFGTPGDYPDFPEFFMYSEQSNENLKEALSAIGAEFSKRNVEMSKELLAAVSATLRMETGTTFKSVEEYGDYCMGPGCTYKVNGNCRSSPYPGGCDYKGRGYIQLTGYNEYRTFCGEECVVGEYQSVCQCEGEAYCLVTDTEICKPAKALLPEYAGKVFVSYYISKDLVALAQDKNFPDVARRINGDIADTSYYIDPFTEKANEMLQILDSHPSKTEKLLSAISGSEASVEEMTDEEFEEEVSMKKVEVVFRTG